MSRRRLLIACIVSWVAYIGSIGLQPYPATLQEDIAGARELGPVSRAHAISLSDGRTLVVHRLAEEEHAWTGIRDGRAIRIPRATVEGEPQTRIYWLGTDSLGRDLASRLAEGARHSLFVALASVLLAVAIGIGIGCLAGWFGGWIDSFVMRSVDLFVSIPRILLLLLLATVLRPSTPIQIAVLAFLTWPGIARLVRAELLRRRQDESVLAAQAAGGSPWRISLMHLLPAALPLIAAAASLRFADTLLLESAVSFLGLGPPPPTVSLGSLLAAGREGFPGNWWMLVFPGSVLVAGVLGFRAVAGERLNADSEPPSVV